MRKQVATFVLAAGMSASGLIPAQPASADCTVDIGGCEQGSCTVNVGVCEGTGGCTVNTGSCQTGACTVNTGRCDHGACFVNMGDCSDGGDAGICVHTVCDNSRPGASSESYGGLGCIFNGGNQASGVVFNDPHKEFGVIKAGPWTVWPTDPTTNTIFNVTTTCTMQTGGATYGLGGVTRTSTTAGNTGVLVDTISFNRVPGASTWLCTTVEWSSTKGHTVVIDDADNDTSNGYQCLEYTYTN